MPDLNELSHINPVPWPFVPAPLVVTVLVLLWTVLVSPHTQYGQNWAVYPVVIAFLIVLAMHGFLLARSPLRFAMAIYAAVHVVFWIPFGIWCLMRISKDSL